MELIVKVTSGISYLVNAYVMNLFDDLPDPVCEVKLSKRPYGIDEPRDEPIPKKPTLGNTTKHPSALDLITVLVGHAALKGERDEMQDAHLCLSDFKDYIKGGYSGEAQRLSLFGVFDGHGGTRASQFLKQRLPENLASRFPSGDVAHIEKDIKRVLVDTYKKTDEEFLKDASNRRPHWKDGSTSTAILLVNNNLYITNVGDSAVVVARCRTDGGMVGLQVTRDHTPLDAGERERLSASGARIVDGRVSGQLEVSRSFGDYHFKRQGLVTCLPDVKKYQLVGERDRFLLLACDGLWKCFSPQEAVEKASNLLAAHPILAILTSGKTPYNEAEHGDAIQQALNAVCAKLVEEAVTQRLCGDNVTLLLLLFVPALSETAAHMPSTSDVTK